MFILKKGHQPGVYVPLRALFLVYLHAQPRNFGNEVCNILSDIKRLSWQVIYMYTQRH